MAATATRSCTDDLARRRRPAAPAARPASTSQTDDARGDLRRAARRHAVRRPHARAPGPAARQAETPVDIEFASRRQATSTCCSAGRRARPPGAAADADPRDVAPERLLFSARRYVSNGRVPDITHVVYVDPEAYAELEPRRIRDVGRAVGRLNRLLPKRQFILMGPGRWGSRGDIRLGVSVTYSDINNTAMLIEIARQQGRLRARPLLRDALLPGPRRGVDPLPAALPRRPAASSSTRTSCCGAQRAGRPAPEFAALAGRAARHRRAAGADGPVLRVLMNAEADEALGLLRPAGTAGQSALEPRCAAARGPRRRALALADAHGRAHRVRDRPGALRRQGVYLFGSTKNGTAGPASDIDLIVHVEPEETAESATWLLARRLEPGARRGQLLRTGRTRRPARRPPGHRRGHRARQSFAAKIGAVTDAAPPLPIGRADEPS